MKEKLENFDQFASDYKSILDKSLQLGGDGGEYFSNYKAMYLRRCLGQNFSGKILDYGCGIGLIAQELMKEFPRATIHGYDVSPVSIEHVPESLKRQGVFVSTMNQLDNDYDVVMVANVLHHIEKSERNGNVAALNPLLKNGGKIFIFEHNPYNPLTQKIVRESPLDKGVVLLPFSETLSYLKNAAFKHVQLNYIVFFPKFLSMLRWAEPFLSWLPLGAQYVAIAQKD